MGVAVTLVFALVLLTGAPAAQAGPRSSVRPFRGFGTWIDIYDKQWDNPEAAVAKMAREKVQTLYLETANYRTDRSIFRRSRAARFIESAHAHGIKVVAWYLPDFKNLKRDLQRSRAAIRFRTPNGHRFDRFALDIESTVVTDIERRNRRMFRLTKRIRDVAGNMAIGAITPDPIGSLYWPNFPYAKVAKRYQALMPMGYFTYRTSGAKGVRRHVRAGIDALRNMTTADKRIHYIGGLAVDANKREVRAYRRVAMNQKILGGSLYDFADTRAGQWDALRALRRLRP